MRYSFLALFVLFSFLLSSCNNGLKENQCSRVDSLLNISTIYQLRLDSLYDDSIAGYYSDIHELNKNLNNLSQALDKKDIILSLNSIEKGFKNIPDKIIFFKREIKYSLDQLNALKQDVESGLLKEGEFETYFRDEQKAIDKIAPAIEENIELLRKYLDEYKSILPDIEIFADSLASF